MSTAQFRRLCRTPVEQWAEGDLTALSAQELGGICQLLGIPHTGTKERRRERIWRARHLRIPVCYSSFGQITPGNPLQAGRTKGQTDDHEPHDRPACRDRAALH